MSCSSSARWPSCSAAPSSLAAQDPTPAPRTRSPYPVTLRYGTGLMDIPMAWVSPNTGDIWLDRLRHRSAGLRQPVRLSFSDRWNTNFTIETHWMKQFSVGFSLYSNNPEWGFFGQCHRPQRGPGDSWKPTVAVGFRNLGPYTHEERLLIGHDVIIDSGGGTTPVDPLWSKGFKTAPTFYAMATKDWKSGKTGLLRRDPRLRHAASSPTTAVSARPTTTRARS